MNQTKNTSRIASWIKAFRLKTLPLAIAAITLGACLAKAESGIFNVPVFILALLTAFLLQILSNLANDYGDFKNGADGEERTDRALASGSITESAMFRALIICSVLCLLTGLALLYSSFDGVSVRFIIFFIIGLSAIAASIKYTAGKNPYGYKGFGDIFVFIFFGPVAVCGVYFLITGNLDSPIWFAAAGMGLLCTGVLNINNIRDLDNDKARGKITIPVLLGYKRAITYHVFLIVSGNLLLLIYALIFFNLNSCPSVNFKLIGLIFLLLEPLYFKGIFSVIKASERMDYNLQLKKLSLLNLMLSLVFGISQIISLC